MEEERFKDRIFKGATRPAMFFGVPIVPFILIVGMHILLIIWTFSLVSPFVALGIGFVLILNILIMRFVNSSDNFRMLQYFMYFQGRRFNRNKHYWNANSISPINIKKRKGN